MTYDFSELDKISSLLDVQESSRGKGLRSIAVDSIRPDPKQPRKTFDEEALSELAASIQSVGIIQPPVVRTHDDGYLLISGERRWRAARQLGWEKIDVIVRDDLNSRAQLVENIQREDLSAWEIYRVIAAELDAGAKQFDLAAAFGKSKQWVSVYAAITRMPEPFITLLRENRVSGVTALQSLHRLYEGRPEVAKRLLDSPELITAAGVAQAAAEASTPSPGPVVETQRPSRRPDVESQYRVTPMSSAGPAAGNDVGQPQPVGNPARAPHLRKRLPIRIRVDYDNANWIVDYTRQRSDANGTVSVRLDGAEGDCRFAPVSALTLESIEIVE